MEYNYRSYEERDALYQYREILREIIEEGEDNPLEEVYIGELPVMLKSV